MSNEIESEQTLSRDEIADYLEAFAGNLRGEDDVEMDVGGTTLTLRPPAQVEFEVEIEDEEEDDGVERSIEIELEWMRQDGEDDLRLR